MIDRWAVLTAVSGRELEAHNKLSALDVQVYCPVIKSFTKPKHKNKPIEVIQAAFPGYLFAECGFNDFNKSTLIGLNIAQLRLGGVFCTVDNDEIERLRIDDVARATQAKVLAVTPFKIGDYVKVTSGPLQGMTGLVQVGKAQCCTLNISGFSTRVDMPNFSLSKLDEVTTLQ